MEIDQIKSDLLQIVAMYEDESCNDDNIVYATFAMIRKAHEVAQMLLLEGRFGEMQRCLALCRAILGTDERNNNTKNVARSSRRSTLRSSISVTIVPSDEKNTDNHTAMDDSIDNNEHSYTITKNNNAGKLINETSSQLGSVPSKRLSVKAADRQISLSPADALTSPLEIECEKYSEPCLEREEQEIKQVNEQRKCFEEHVSVDNEEQEQEKLLLLSSREHVQMWKEGSSKEEKDETTSDGTTTASNTTSIPHNVDLIGEEIQYGSDYLSSSHSHGHHRRAVHSLNAEDRFLFTCLRERTEQLQRELNTNRKKRKGRDMSYYLHKLQIHSNNVSISVNPNVPSIDIGKSNTTCTNEKTQQDLEHDEINAEPPNTEVNELQSNLLQNSSIGNFNDYHLPLLSPVPPERGVAIAAKSTLHQYKLPRQLPPLVTNCKPFFKEYLGSAHHELSNLSINTTASSHYGRLCSASHHARAHDEDNYNMNNNEDNMTNETLHKNNNNNMYDDESNTPMIVDVSEISPTLLATPSSASILRPTSRQWRTDKNHTNTSHLLYSPKHTTELPNINKETKYEHFHEYNYNNITDVDDTNTNNNNRIKNDNIINKTECAPFDVHVLNLESNTNRVNSANSIHDTVKSDNSMESQEIDNINNVNNDTKEPYHAKENKYINEVTNDEQVTRASYSNTDSDESDDSDNAVNVDLNKSMISLSDLLSSRLSNHAINLCSDLSSTNRSWQTHNLKSKRPISAEKFREMCSSHINKVSFHGLKYADGLPHHEPLEQSLREQEWEQEHPHYTRKVNEEEQEYEELNEEELLSSTQRKGKNDWEEWELSETLGESRQWRLPEEMLSQSNLLAWTQRQDAEEIISSTTKRGMKIVQTHILVPETLSQNKQATLHDKRMENQRLHRKHSSIQRSKSILSEQFKARCKAGWSKPAKTSFCFGNLVKTPVANHFTSSASLASLPTPMARNKYRSKYNTYNSTTTTTLGNATKTLSKRAMPKTDTFTLKSRMEEKEHEEQSLQSEQKQSFEQRAAREWAAIQRRTKLSNLAHMGCNVRPLSANHEELYTYDTCKNKKTSVMEATKTETEIATNAKESIVASTLPCQNSSATLEASLSLPFRKTTVNQYQTEEAFLLKNALAVKRADELMRRATGMVKHVEMQNMSLIEKRVTDSTNVHYAINRKDESSGNEKSSEDEHQNELTSHTKVKHDENETNTKDKKVEGNIAGVREIECNDTHFTVQDNSENNTLLAPPEQEDTKEVIPLAPLLSQLQSIPTLSASAKEKLSQIAQRTLEKKEKLEFTYKAMHEKLTKDNNALRPKKYEVKIEDTSTWRKQRKKRCKNSAQLTQEQQAEQGQQLELQEELLLSETIRSKLVSNSFTSNSRPQSGQSSVWTISTSNIHNVPSTPSLPLDSINVTITSPTCSDTDEVYVLETSESTDNINHTNVMKSSRNNYNKGNEVAMCSQLAHSTNINTVPTSNITKTTADTIYENKIDTQESEEDRQCLSNAKEPESSLEKSSELNTPVEQSECELQEMLLVQTLTGKSTSTSELMQQCEEEQKMIHKQIEKMECSKTHAFDTSAHNLVIHHLTRNANTLRLEQENAMPCNAVSKLIRASCNVEEPHPRREAMNENSYNSENRTYKHECDAKSTCVIDPNLLTERMMEICRVAQLKSGKIIKFNFDALMANTLHSLTEIITNCSDNKELQMNLNDVNAQVWKQQELVQKEQTDVHKNNRNHSSVALIGMKYAAQANYTNDDVKTPFTPSLSSSSSSTILPSETNVDKHDNWYSTESSSTLLNTVNENNRTITLASTVDTSNFPLEILGNCRHDALHRAALQIIMNTQNDNNDVQEKELMPLRSSYVPELQELHSCHHWAKHLPRSILQNCLPLRIATIIIQRTWKQYTARQNVQHRQRCIASLREEEVRLQGATLYIQCQIRVFIARRKLNELRTRRNVDVKRRVVRERRMAHVQHTHHLERERHTHKIIIKEKDQNIQFDNDTTSNDEEYQHHVKYDDNNNKCKKSNSHATKSHSSYYPLPEEEEEEETEEEMCNCNIVDDSDNKVTEDEDSHSSTSNMISSNSSDSSDNCLNRKEEEEEELFEDTSNPMGQVVSLTRRFKNKQKNKKSKSCVQSQSHSRPVCSIIRHDRARSVLQLLPVKSELRALGIDVVSDSTEEHENKENDEEEIENEEEEYGDDEMNEESDDNYEDNDNTDKCEKCGRNVKRTKSQHKRRYTKELSLTLLQEASQSPLPLSHNKPHQHHQDEDEDENDINIDDKYIKVGQAGSFAQVRRYGTPLFMRKTHLALQLKQIQKKIAARVILHSYRVYCARELKRFAHEINALNNFVTRQSTAEEVFNHHTPFCGKYIPSRRHYHVNKSNKYQKSLGHSTKCNNIAEEHNNKYAKEKQDECEEDEETKTNFNNSEEYEEQEEELSNHTPRTPDDEAALRMRLLLHRYSGDVHLKFMHRMYEARRQGDYRTPLQPIHRDELEQIRVNTINAQNASMRLKQAERQEAAERAFKEQRRRVKAVDMLQRIGRGFMRRKWISLQLMKLHEKKRQLEEINAQRRRSTWMSNMLISSWHERSGSIVAVPSSSASSLLVCNTREVHEMEVPLQVHIHIMKQIQRRLPLSLVVDGALPERHHAQCKLVQLIERFVICKASLTMTFQRYVYQLVCRVQRAWRRYYATHHKLIIDKQQ